jgi:hypothetical protein
LDTLRSVKTSTGACAEARTLVIIGDNASDNKNNVNFAFLADLVVHRYGFVLLSANIRR